MMKKETKPQKTPKLLELCAQAAGVFSKNELDKASDKPSRHEVQTQMRAELYVKLKEQVQKLS